MEKEKRGLSEEMLHLPHVAPEQQKEQEISKPSHSHGVIF